MNTVHPYQSEITQWLSDTNQTIMARSHGYHAWNAMSCKELLGFSRNPGHIDEVWVGLYTETNKPPQYTMINGRAVKKGITKLNPSQTAYYVVDLYNEDIVQTVLENGILQFWIDRGLVHETREGALEMAKALLKL
jgi:hypothetical protein